MKIFLQIFYLLWFHPLIWDLAVNMPSKRPISSHFAPYTEGQIENLSLLRSAVTDLKHHITFCLGDLLKLGPLSFCARAVRYENIFVCFRDSISRVREQRRGVHAIRS